MQFNNDISQKPLDTVSAASLFSSSMDLGRGGGEKSWPVWHSLFNSKGRLFLSSAMNSPYLASSLRTISLINV